MSDKRKVRNSHLPLSLFMIILGGLLVVTGLQMALLVILINADIPAMDMVYIIISYWVIVAIVSTLFVLYLIKKYYDKPMKTIAKAASKVAQGDFSVYVPPIHTPVNMDYLDVMIIDFNKMVEELGSMETLKTDFFSNVSHEIKTPIAVISNYAQLLEKEDDLSEVQKEYVKNIIMTSDKLSELITNILKLNRLEKQRIQYEKEKYDICEQLCECLLSYENRIDEKNIEIEADMEDKVMIYSDKGLLEIVWNNLFSNAVKFTEKNGKISIIQESDNKEITVIIKDTGCGMSEETISHIYEKFYQGESSHSTQGNGLGLALCYRILQLCGGSIKAESMQEKGTTFTVKLPVNDTDLEVYDE